jgi:hypothetical protein
LGIAEEQEKGEKESIVVDGAVKLGDACPFIRALQKYVSVLLTWHAKHNEDHGDHTITDHTVSHVHTEHLRAPV